MRHKVLTVVSFSCKHCEGIVVISECQNDARVARQCYTALTEKNGPTILFPVVCCDDILYDITQWYERLISVEFSVITGYINTCISQTSTGSQCYFY